ncbi:MAG TPA: DUF3465 domain-containing protein [Acidobacteriaceae bacterium]|nr:DUF3465 domain-containing protein [Acidobacteriaceae bacterium]
MKKLLPIIIVAGIAALAEHFYPGTLPVHAPPAAVAYGGSDLARAFENHASNIRVRGQGSVIKILPDDNYGSRHQRFIVRLPSGQTVLIAHNIGLAPRVSPLHKGDSVSFSGEYEWNPKGGVVHWTHRDPAGRHRAGWVKRAGQTFQ